MSEERKYLEGELARHKEAAEKLRAEYDELVTEERAEEEAKKSQPRHPFANISAGDSGLFRSVRMGKLGEWMDSEQSRIEDLTGKLAELTQREETNRILSAVEGHSVAIKGYSEEIKKNTNATVEAVKQGEGIAVTMKWLTWIILVASMIMAAANVRSCQLADQSLKSQSQATKMYIE